jgi:hypothetical protein
MRDEIDLAIKKTLEVAFLKTRRYGKLYYHEIQLPNVHICGANPMKMSSQSKHNLTNPLCYKSTYGNGKHKTN